MAGLGQVELLQLPGWEGQIGQLLRLVLQVQIQLEQLCQLLLQQLSEQLLFVGDAVDMRGHGGGEGAVELLQLDSLLLGLFQHDDEDEQLGLGWGHLLLPPWSLPRSVRLCQSPWTAGVGVQLAIGWKIQEKLFQPQPMQGDDRSLRAWQTNSV